MPRISILVIVLFIFYISPIYSANNPISENQLLECYEQCEPIIKNLKKYAKNGSLDAQVLLGLSYKTGELMGVIDPDKAWKWMKRARNRQFSPAYYILSLWLRRGYNTEIDIALADEYLQLAAAKEYGPALVDLGIQYYKNKDNEKGYQLLEQAAGKGSLKAKRLLKLLSPKVNTVAQISKARVEKNTLEKSLKEKKPKNDNVDKEVITSYANKLEPIQLFEFILEKIDEQKVYTTRGTTGSRIGGRKCGESGTGCASISGDNYRLLTYGN
ncbi:MAG: hypothetical protein COA74_06275 [Gammaproteobacteria bacterium]|nr:MAG: hypothetical protein COA74_06275 [Gammaproteobacteria bacterium]